MANNNERTSIPKRLSLQPYPAVRTASKSVTTFGSGHEDLAIPSSTASWRDSYRASYLSFKPSFDRRMTLDPEASFLDLDPSFDRNPGSDLESDRRSESFDDPDIPPSRPSSFGKSLPRLSIAKVRGETYSREIPHDQSATERLHHFAQNDPSERSLWKRFSGMYGRDSYDEKLAEMWATEFQDSVQYPNKSTRAVLLISAILPYIIVSCQGHFCPSTIQEISSDIHRQKLGILRPCSYWYGTQNNQPPVTDESLYYINTLCSNTHTDIHLTIQRAC